MEILYRNYSLFLQIQYPSLKDPLYINSNPNHLLIFCTIINCVWKKMLVFFTFLCNLENRKMSFNKVLPLLIYENIYFFHFANSWEDWKNAYKTVRHWQERIQMIRKWDRCWTKLRHSSVSREEGKKLRNKTFQGLCKILW